ncbi:hypothetical protein GLA29479_2295 [Lysobacter antibioticus]|uniref:Uncharacterized protein n=1 Tax=Lysobacter antibioticus TaxID=84531 RepID=A0A0S2FG10_LYSAN|nr:hypothetical protein GLA29479_2295 [Lysobacter antibioticus]ALN82468.1 hypothetical protein LA76x_4358 [Lysobacter antibioticus]
MSENRIYVVDLKHGPAPYPMSEMRAFLLRACLFRDCPACHSRAM